MYDHAERAVVSVIGRTSQCTTAAFSAWARRPLAKAECDALLAQLAAAKLKLSPGEQAFMQTLLAEDAAGLASGDCISYSHTEGCAVGGLARKGLLVRHDAHTVQVTDLVTAWLRRALVAHDDRSSQA